MNEKGVAVAMAAVPDARTPAGRTVGSLGVMRQVLDRAASVEEAVAIFRGASIDFSGGPPLHYLVADAAGAGAVIEYVGGRVHVIERGSQPYIAMTNFVLTGDAPADDRYRTRGRRRSTRAQRRDDAADRRSTCCRRPSRRTRAGAPPTTSRPARSRSRWARSTAAGC